MGASNGLNRRERRKIAVRESIVEAAIGLFDQHGLAEDRRRPLERQHRVDADAERLPGRLGEDVAEVARVPLSGGRARRAVLPLLEPGESTVGVVVNVEHTAATPLGAQVVCRARVIYSDGPLISFQLEAHDEHEKIAIGTHKLRVIEATRLAKRVQKKTQN